MELEFPKNFLWGTSTSAAQIETAHGHQFEGLEASDGFVFQRTIDHEQRRSEDLEYITQFGNLYRFSLNWARLQPKPMEPFHTEVVAEYHHFFQQLRKADMKLMLVLYHFAHPRWFEDEGGWERERNINYFIDFSRRCIDHFGDYISYWNTFNEPNAYVVMAYLLGHFPPHRRRRLMTARRVLQHMGAAHDVVYDLIRFSYPEDSVGIAHSVAWFEGTNWLGNIPAGLCDWWYNRRAAHPFRKTDFWGINYYAYVPFDPRPVTEIERPGRLDELEVTHDEMWGLRPEGLGLFLRRFAKRYNKPVMVTERGICTEDDQQRIEAIKSDLRICHEVLSEGIDLRGYVNWSTFDNFEWHLGPSYRFGLVRVNLYTKERKMTRAGEFYRQVTQHNRISL